MHEIKEMLLSNPHYIENILMNLNFYKIHKSHNMIVCGNSKNGKGNSIHITLNKYINCIDFKYGTKGDFFSFLMKKRNLELRDVINIIKKELGVDSFSFTRKNSNTIFGGVYQNITPRKSSKIELKTYDEDILNNYKFAYNIRFLEDNINFESQKFFDVRFDIETQRIIFPIRDCYGNIIGIKGRANWDVIENEPKYLYLVPCSISKTIFGYSQNYKYLTDNKIIIFEAEKSTMQAYSYGCRNAISLGGNSINPQQCKLIMTLNPTEIVFALDEGLDISFTMDNIKTLKLFSKFSNVKIKYWDYTKSSYIPNKSKKSITDMGKEIFENILKNELKEVVS